MNKRINRFLRIEQLALFILPVVYFIAGSYFRNLLGNLSLRSCDPDYIYFMSGLTLSDGSLKLAHIDNPGTPLQLFLAVTFRIIYFFRASSLPYLEDIFLHPDLYLSVSNLLITALTAGLLLYAAKKIYQYTHSVFYALLVQTTPFLPVIWYDIIGRIVPELMMSFPVVLLTVLSIKVYSREEHPSRFDVFLFAFLSAFGLSVKLTYFPLWFIPFFMLYGWKQKLVFLGTSVLLFFLIAFPVTLHLSIFWGWVKNLIIHSGQYGTGETNVLDLTALKKNLATLFYYEKPFLGIFFGFIMVFLIYLLTHRKKREKQVTLMSIAIITTVMFQLLLVGKHYAHRYFIPVLMLSPLMFFIITQLFLKLWRHQAAIYVVNILITIFLLWQVKVNHDWLVIKSETLSNEVEKRLPTWHYASLLDTKDNYLFIASQNYGSPFIEYTLTYSHIWGYHKKRREYAPILDKLYPHTFNFFTWDNSLKYWVEKFDVKKIMESGKLIYLYLEQDNEEVYNKFLEKLQSESKTVFSAERNLLFKNPATSEVIYRWQFTIPEQKIH